jgi:hypothetical protein
VPSGPNKVVVILPFWSLAVDRIIWLSVNIPQFYLNQRENFKLHQTSIPARSVDLRLKISKGYFCQKPNPKTLDITAKIKYESLQLKHRP